MYSHVWPLGNITIRRCSLFGVGMAMLWKCFTVGVGFEVLYAQAMAGTQFFLLLLVGQDVEHLFTSPAQCLSICCLASCRDDNGINL